MNPMHSTTNTECPRICSPKTTCTPQMQSLLASWSVYSPLYKIQATMFSLFVWTSSQGSHLQKQPTAPDTHVLQEEGDPGTYMYWLHTAVFFQFHLRRFCLPLPSPFLVSASWLPDPSKSQVFLHNLPDQKTLTTFPRIFPSIKNYTEQHPSSPGQIVRSCSALFLCKAYSFHPYHSLYFSVLLSLSFTRGKVTVTATKSRLLRDLQEKQDRGIFSNTFTLLLAAQAAV